MLIQIPLRLNLNNLHYFSNIITYLFAGPIRLPCEVPEEVCGGFAQSVWGGGGAELLDHGGHKTGGGTEEGLDVRVAEGEVGESDDSVSAHLSARGAVRVGRWQDEVAVNITLDLKKEESLLLALK